MHHCFMISWLLYTRKNMVRFSKVKTKTGGKNMIVKSERFVLSAT